MDNRELRNDLERIVGLRPPGANESIKNVLERLDDYVNDNAGLNKRLKHFLEKRSYQKALQWLDSPEMPHHP